MLKVNNVNEDRGEEVGPAVARSVSWKVIVSLMMSSPAFWEHQRNKTGLLQKKNLLNNFYQSLMNE
jgi:hypothetical protein